jgi:hypothetical protein
MKTICTSILTFALLMALSVSSSAQTCNIGTISPAGINFGTPLSVTTANGFEGTGTTLTGGNLTYPSSSTSTITSPVYFYNSPQSAIYIRFTLDPANGAQPVISPVITIKYGAGGSLTIPCTTNSITPSDNSTTYFLVVSPSSDFPASTNFTVSVQITTGNRSIEAINFTTNAILAPNTAVLPVKFGAFTAKSSAAAVNLNWTIDAEENTKGYEVERSTDGQKYAAIGSVAANGSRSYSFTDASPAAAAYYRIKALDNDGKYGYSIVLKVKGTESLVDVKAFFSSKHSITIQHDQAAAGSRVTVTTADGKVLKSLPVAAGAQQTLVDVSSAVPGLLLVRFESAKGQVETIKVVKP